MPQGLVTALQNVNSAIGDHSAAHPEDMPPELLAFYFDTLHFTRLAESFGAHSLFDVTIADDDMQTGDISSYQDWDKPREWHSSQTLTVTLHAGSYDIYCPVGDHKMLGMDVHITVS